MAKHQSEIRVSGHIVDSLILSKVFDTVMDLGGEFEVLEVNIGKRKKDTSFARMLVGASTRAGLEKILENAYRHGATSETLQNVKTQKAPKNMVMPSDFYSTTNNRTMVCIDGVWISVKNAMMDKCIVIKGKTAMCVPIRDVVRGDKIVIGEEGVKIIPAERPREGLNVFEFMGSQSSSERPTQHIAKHVASDILAIKRRKGRIILVGGPAIVHTGAADSIAYMIREGLVDAVLAGNALAVHDIEYATMGTSLGMNVRDGTLAVRGHRNHMSAINSVFAAGSFEKMVSMKKLNRGIVYECVRKKIPLVLASSIRDDGPLPGVITDIVEAQKQYKKVLQGADLVIMISTMLHSIATGNMLPADVKVIIMDINQPTVTKLMDRGTWQALGIVTDVGAFMPLVEREIRDAKRRVSRKRKS